MTQMKMKLIISFLTIGFVILIIFPGLISGAPNPASGVENYVGSEKCISCHNKSHPEIVKGWQTSPHHLNARLLNESLGSGNYEVKLNTSFDKEHILIIIGKNDSNLAFVGRDFKVYRPFRAYRPKQDASLTCFGCHTTGYFVSQKQFVEAGIGCEACHGPGKMHVDSKGSPNTILNITKLPPERRRMICGQCHCKGTDLSGKYLFPVMEGERPFRPGDDLEKGFIDVKPTVKTAHAEYSTFVMAPKPYSDQLCTDCHSPHNKGNNPSMLVDTTSALCLKCHGNRTTTNIPFIEPERHHRDAKINTCWTCHDEHVHLH